MTFVHFTLNIRNPSAGRIRQQYRMATFERANNIQIDTLPLGQLVVQTGAGRILSLAERSKGADPGKLSLSSADT